MHTQNKSTAAGHTAGRSFKRLKVIHRASGPRSNSTVGTCWGDGANQNAEFIARACNSHDNLVESLERVTNLLDDMFNGVPYSKQDVLGWMEIARAAIARAKGVQS